MSGFALERVLKNNPLTENIPIISSQQRIQKMIRTGFNLGADDYISKSLSIRKVLVRVRAAIPEFVLHRTVDANITR